ncbi:hypothetical protein KO465_10570 [Candidatus Micrarchaeota archaeon]|jgi:uncharacterized protein (UPF0333 family)|nr:hypothetical protein [Candidatus Micrarchaeota archaeon]
MKAQVSVEFLIVIGVMMVLLLPVIVYAFSVLNFENQIRIDISKSQTALDRISNTVDSVGSAGTGSALYTDIFVSKVQNVRIENANQGEIIFTLLTSDGTTSMYRITQYNLTNSDNSLENIKTGNYRLLINATNSTHVDISMP